MAVAVLLWQYYLMDKNVIRRSEKTVGEPVERPGAEGLVKPRPAAFMLPDLEVVRARDTTKPGVGPFQSDPTKDDDDDDRASKVIVYEHDDVREPRFP